MRMKMGFFLAVLASLLLTAGAHAAVDASAPGPDLPAGSSEAGVDASFDEAFSSWTDRLYVDATASWGMANTAIAAGSGNSTITQVGLGLAAGWRLERRVWLGVSTDFRSAGLGADLLSTMSEVEGARWNIASPTVGVSLGDAILKAEVSLLGDYRFARLDGSRGFTLRSPRGIRMTYLYPMMKNLYAGLQADVTSWGERQLDSQAASERLLQREVLWQASLTAAWVF